MVMAVLVYQYTSGDNVHDLNGYDSVMKLIKLLYFKNVFRTCFYL